MPRLDSDMRSGSIEGTSFGYTGTRLERLSATEYTLVTIAVDVSSSVNGFKSELSDSLVAAVEACKRSPRSENLLIRVITFSTSVGDVNELHGFKLLSEINFGDYQSLDVGGMTPLFDATYSAIGSMIDYGKDLAENDFLVNGIAFVITDGGDNASVATPSMIQDQVATVLRSEELESLHTILIGVNADVCRAELEQFVNQAQLDQYTDSGDASKGNLAKLADFVSQSISSQSQSLGTGGASQNISATI